MRGHNRDESAPAKICFRAQYLVARPALYLPSYPTIPAVRDARHRYEPFAVTPALAFTALRRSLSPVINMASASMDSFEGLGLLFHQPPESCASSTASQHYLLSTASSNSNQAGLKEDVFGPAMTALDTDTAGKGPGSAAAEASETRTSQGSNEEESEANSSTASDAEENEDDSSKESDTEGSEDESSKESDAEESGNNSDNESDEEESDSESRQESREAPAAAPAPPALENGVACYDFKPIWIRARLCYPLKRPAGVLRNAERSFLRVVWMLLKEISLPTPADESSKSQDVRDGFPCCCCCDERLVHQRKAWDAAPYYHERACVENKTWFFPKETFEKCGRALGRFFEDISCPAQIIIYLPGLAQDSKEEPEMWGIKGSQLWMVTTPESEPLHLIWSARRAGTVANKCNASEPYLLYQFERIHPTNKMMVWI